MKVFNYLFMDFDVHVTVHRETFLIIKPTRCTNFWNLFWNETLHVSDSFSSIIRSFPQYTRQWCMSYRFADSLRTGSGFASCQQTCMTYTIAVCTVENSWWWKRNCPKHAEFHSKINLRN